MTAGERLVALSGGGSLSAGARLVLLGAGSTAGARLVARSGLPTATAAVHLMYDPVAPSTGETHDSPLIVTVGRLMTRN